MRRIVYFHANETHFHRKGYELSLVLKSGFSGTQKWPIANTNDFRGVFDLEGKEEGYYRLIIRG